MNTIKIKEVKANSRMQLTTELVTLETMGFEIEKDVTQSWIKAGSPAFGTSNFKTFAAEILEKNKQLKPGRAFSVTLDKAKADTRLRPYKVISIVNEGTRKFKREFQIVEADLVTKIVKSVNEAGEEVKETKVTVKSLGAIAGTASKKAEALELMKDLISDNKGTEYVIVVAKVVAEGEPIAAYGLYTPSISAHEGSFAVFGIERN